MTQNSGSCPHRLHLLAVPFSGDSSLSPAQFGPEFCQGPWPAPPSSLLQKKHVTPLLQGNCLVLAWPGPPGLLLGQGMNLHERLPKPQGSRGTPMAVLPSVTEVRACAPGAPVLADGRAVSIPSAPAFPCSFTATKLSGQCPPDAQTPRTVSRSGGLADTVFWPVGE